MTPLDIFKLKDNPFSVTPPAKDRPVIWAGRQSIKDELINIIKNSFISSPSRYIINWGEWGSGKTHSMRYFSQRDVLNSISEELNTKKALPITISCPRERVLESLYILILDGISLDRIRNVILKVALKGEFISDPITRINRIKEYGFSDMRAKIFSGLIDSNLNSTAERYIYLEAGLADLRNLEVPRRIRTKVEQLNFLADILRLLISEESEYFRIFLWIDEMEQIENFSGRELMEIRSFLRSLIDLVPNGLTLFLNATYKTSEELNGFLDYLGPAIKDRIFKVVYLPFLDEEDAKIYVKSMINNPVYRSTEDKKKLEKDDLEYFPFDEKSIEVLFKKLIGHLKRNPTPRNINDALTSTMEYFARDDSKMSLLESMRGTIDSSFIEENWDSIKLGVTVEY